MSIFSEALELIRAGVPAQTVTAMMATMQPGNPQLAQPQPQPMTQPQLQPMTQPQLQPMTQPQPQPMTQPQLQPMTQPQLQPQLQPMAQPQTQPQLQPMAQPMQQMSFWPQAQPQQLDVAQELANLKKAIQTANVGGLQQPGYQLSPMEQLQRQNDSVLASVLYPDDPTIIKKE